jgi:hypothetical protein
LIFVAARWQQDPASRGGLGRAVLAANGIYVTPIRTATGTPGTAIKVGTYPIAIIIVAARK